MRQENFVVRLAFSAAAALWAAAAAQAGPVAAPRVASAAHPVIQAIVAVPELAGQIRELALGPASAAEPAVGSIQDRLLAPDRRVVLAAVPADYVDRISLRGSAEDVVVTLLGHPDFIDWQRGPLVEALGEPAVARIEDEAKRLKDGRQAVEGARKAWGGGDSMASADALAGRLARFFDLQAFAPASTPGESLESLFAPVAEDTARHYAASDEWRARPNQQAALARIDLSRPQDRALLAPLIAQGDASVFGGPLERLTATQGPVGEGLYWGGLSVLRKAEALEAGAREEGDPWRLDAILGEMAVVAAALAIYTGKIYDRFLQAYGEGALRLRRLRG